jgi:hypothetical protein
MIIYYHVAVVLVWLNTVVKQFTMEGIDGAQEGGLWSSP